MINRDTLLCISLAGRPGNFGTRFHNYLYDKLGLNYLYKAFTTKDIEAAVKGFAHWVSAAVRSPCRLKRAAYRFLTRSIRQQSHRLRQHHRQRRREVNRAKHRLHRGQKPDRQPSARYQRQSDDSG